jgi:hypothetical protein
MAKGLCRRFSRFCPKTHRNCEGWAKNGKLEVQVFLTSDTGAAIDQLKKLGFELIGRLKSGKLVIGRIGVEKLKALSELAVVTYVSPMS